METHFKSIPGLADNCLEIFEPSPKAGLHGLYAGKEHDFYELPISALELIREDLDNNQLALGALELAGVHDPIEQLYQYSWCRNRSFDLTPDFQPGKLSTPEYVNCELRDNNCPFGEAICIYPLVPNGQLTRQEMRVLRYISQDLPDKQIADKMGLSHAMVATYRGRLEYKIGCKAKPGVAYFAGINNITH